MSLAQEHVDAVVMEPYLRSGNAMAVTVAARTGFGPPLMVSLSASGRTGDQTSYEPTLFDVDLIKPVSMVQLGEILALRCGHDRQRVRQSSACQPVR